MYIECNVPTAQLVATQPDLEENALADYLRQRDAGQQLLVHARMVDGEYRILDGHHNVTIADLIDGAIDVCVHENPDDYDPHVRGSYLVHTRWESVKRTTFGPIPDFRKTRHHWLQEEQWVRSHLGVPAPSDSDIVLEKKAA